MPAMDMDRRALLVFNRLRPMHIFRGLKDEPLVEVTRQLERETIEAGQTICAEGQPAAHFYIVDRGRVRLTRQGSQREQVLEPGDFLGAEGLWPGTVSPYTATAAGDVHVLRLEKETLMGLAGQDAHLLAGLRLMAETRQWLFSRPWEWINRQEMVYFIARRHPWLLWQSLFTPLVAAVLVLGLAGASWYFLGQGAALWTLALLGLPALGWIGWVYVDWGNDFYVITNQRVVYVEKVVLIYDSRTTLAMNALTAVAAQTESLTDRLLEYGDVSVKTLSKPLVMRAIAFPQVVAALVDEHIGRYRARSRDSDMGALKSAIRTRIAPPLAEPKAERPPAEPVRVTVQQQMRQFFSLQLRFDQGDTIIYRKHWWLLLKDLWVQSALILADLGLIGLALAGFIPAPLVVVLLVALVLFIPASLWWLYEFQDWRNDLYQVTPDVIVDIYRKPLGRETRDTASLEHIQGLRSERPTLISRLLNFGNVIATIPGKEFTFDDVYDPAGVQEDIQRRIEAQRARKTRQDAARRREELADVLSAYYLATKEVEKNEASQPPGG
jgi:hypothetical protein